MRFRLLVSWTWFFLVLFRTTCSSRSAMHWRRRPACSDRCTWRRFWRCVPPCRCTGGSWGATRRQLVFGVYQFFVACLVAFAVLLARGHGDAAWLRNAFFVWVSVFNLYVVAVFWSVMADLFSAEEGKTWFGAVAAAGTAGSIVASLVGRLTAERLGLAWLMAAAIGALELSIAMAWLALRFEPRGSAAHSNSSAAALQRPHFQRIPPRGPRTVVASRYLLMICVFTAIGKFAATFVYNNFQHALRAQGLGVAERTELFSTMNFYSQSGTLAFQAVLAAVLMRLAGVGAMLATACGVIVGLFAWLAVDAGLWPLMVAKVAQEIVGYGLLVPGSRCCSRW